MLNELRSLHDEVLRLLGELERLTAQPEPPVETLTATRASLTRASRRRSTYLETSVYPELLRTAAPAQQDKVKVLRDTGREGLLASVQHIGKWSLREVLERWRDYCAASATMRAQMRARISEEQAVLYPILASRGEGG
jgi:hypothetical protein